jgi:hypothetical protein
VQHCSPIIIEPGTIRPETLSSPRHCYVHKYLAVKSSHPPNCCSLHRGPAASPWILLWLHARCACILHLEVAKDNTLTPSSATSVCNSTCSSGSNARNIVLTATVMGNDCLQLLLLGAAGHKAPPPHLGAVMWTSLHAFSDPDTPVRLVSER